MYKYRCIVYTSNLPKYRCIVQKLPFPNSGDPICLLANCYMFFFAWTRVCLYIFPTLIADFKDPVLNWYRVRIVELHIAHAPLLFSLMCHAFTFVIVNWPQCWSGQEIDSMNSYNIHCNMNFNLVVYPNIITGLKG